MNLTQQQAGEVIGISPAAAKNVFALYEWGDRAPSYERMQNVVSFIERAIALVELQRQPRQPGGIRREAPPEELDDIHIGEIMELT